MIPSQESPFGVSMLELEHANSDRSRQLQWLDDLSESDAWSVVVHYFDGRRRREVCRTLDQMRAAAPLTRPDREPSHREIL